MDLVTILIIVLIIAVLFGGGWGYRSGALTGGHGLIGLLLVIILIVFLVRHL